MKIDKRDRVGARTPTDLDRQRGLQRRGVELEKALEKLDLLPTEREDFSSSLYRVIDGEKEWLNPPMNEEYVWYRTMEYFLGAPVYTGIVAASGNDVDVGDIPRGYAILRKSQVVDHYFGRFVQVWITRNGEDNIPDL